MGWSSETSQCLSVGHAGLWSVGTQCARESREREGRRGNEKRIVKKKREDKCGEGETYFS